MVTTVVDTRPAVGRHRLGLPGLVHVRSYLRVEERSLLSRLLGIGRRSGRHHDLVVPTPAVRDSAGRLVPATLA